MDRIGQISHDGHMRLMMVLVRHVRLMMGLLRHVRFEGECVMRTM